MNKAVHPFLTNPGACAAGAGRILATLILAFGTASAWSQNNASSASVGVSSSGAVQASSFQNGIGRADGPSSRVTLSSRPAPAEAGSGQSAISSPPPITSTSATSYQHGGTPGYGVDDLGYVSIEVPYGGVHNSNGEWAGPVLPDERHAERRRLSTEERLRLRSDIRDASRNMYEHPRAR